MLHQSRGGQHLSPSVLKNSPDHDSRPYVSAYKIEELFHDMVDSVLAIDSAAANYNYDSLPKSESELRIHLIKFLMRRHTRQEIEQAAGVTFIPHHPLPHTEELGVRDDVEMQQGASTLHNRQQQESNKQQPNATSTTAPPFLYRPRSPAHRLRDDILNPKTLERLTPVLARAQSELQRYEEAERVREECGFSTEQADAWFLHIFDGLAAEDGLASKLALMQAYDRVVAVSSRSGEHLEQSTTIAPPGMSREEKSSSEAGGVGATGRNGEDAADLDTRQGGTTDGAVVLEDKEKNADAEADGSNEEGADGHGDDKEASDENEKWSFAQFLRFIADREQQQMEKEEEQMGPMTSGSTAAAGGGATTKTEASE